MERSGWVLLELRREVDTLRRALQHGMVVAAVAGSVVGMSHNIFFIESNHKIMRISRSEKLINSSRMMPEQRNHMLGAVWSSSLSEDSCENQGGTDSSPSEFWEYSPYQTYKTYLT